MSLGRLNNRPAELKQKILLCFLFETVMKIRNKEKMKKTTWMTILSEHYQIARKNNPNEHLLILLDIDDTIIDIRPIFQLMLNSYDQRHGTEYFNNLSVKDISLQEEELDSLLETMGIPAEEQKAITDWVHKYDWTQSEALTAHKPFNGVLEMIRWFQIQPNTSVGLVTGRYERIREETLHILNLLGESYRVNFRSDMLFLRPDGWGTDVPTSKVAGLRHFQERGYRVIAFIDNEPENLEAISMADPNGDILLLHAETMFASRRARLPKRAVSGNRYVLSELVPENQPLPGRIHMVWNGVNTNRNLQEFLKSDVSWGKVDVRSGINENNLILRADSFLSRLPGRNEEWTRFEPFLEQLLSHEKGINIHITEGNPLLKRITAVLQERDIDPGKLWFSCDLINGTRNTFASISNIFPSAHLQCDTDFLIPMILNMPKQAERILGEMSDWGINLFSFTWKQAHPGRVLDKMNEWGYPVNFQGVPDLEAFLHAVYLMPYSVTSDFNFPQWNFYGAGAGVDGSFYTYPQFASSPQVR